MHGAVEREDGGEELYRAAFIRLSLDANREQHFALGAFRFPPNAGPEHGQAGRQLGKSSF